MFFFSFYMREEVERQINTMPGDYLVFGETEEKADDGTPLCVLIGSAMEPAIISAIIQLAMTQREYDHVVRYFSYTREELKKGLHLADLERRSQEN